MDTLDDKLRNSINFVKLMRDLANKKEEKRIDLPSENLDTLYEILNEAREELQRKMVRL